MKRHIIRTILIISFLLKVSAWLYSQDTVVYRSYSQEFKVYFQFDTYTFNPDFKGNRSVISDLIEEVDKVGSHFIDSIVVISHSSPEGVYEHNIKLSKRRASSMKNYIAKERPDVAGLLKMRSAGEAWEALAESIQRDTVISDKQKQKAIDIINSDINIGTKKWRMEQLPAYRYLLAHHYRPLRNSAICIIYFKPEISIACLDIEYDEIYIEEMAPLTIDTIKVELMEYGKKELFFVRTNLLLPLLNIGVEVPIGNHWSVGADYYFPWAPREDDHKDCYQALAWNLEGRYWFGKDRKVEDRLEGHSVGLSAMGGYYDLERNYDGIQGTLYNISVDYLYALPLFKDKIHMEFSLGLGYFFSPKAQPYAVLEEGGLAYKKGYTKDIHWIGPNKAGISIVVPIKAKGRAR